MEKQDKTVLFSSYDVSITCRTCKKNVKLRNTVIPGRIQVEDLITTTGTPPPHTEDYEIHVELTEILGHKLYCSENCMTKGETADEL